MKRFDFDRESFEKEIPMHDYFMKRKASSIKKKVPRGLTCLDIGCGSGEMEFLLKDHFKKIIGLDPTPNQIKIAKKRGLKNCDFEVGTAVKLKSRDNSFDVVIIINVMHHIEEKEHVKVLKEAYRVLKKKGRLLVYEHNPLHPLIWIRFYYFSKIDKGERMINPFKMRNMFKKAGFKKTRFNFLISECLGEYYVVGKK